MQLKSILFGTNFLYFLMEFIIFTLIIANLLPYKLFEIQRKFWRGLLWFSWHLLLWLIFIEHEHYIGNPLKSPKFYLNTEIIAFMGGIITNLIHNSGHDTTILKQKVRNIRLEKCEK
jgi:hypothetical protein